MRPKHRSREFENRKEKKTRSDHYRFDAAYAYIDSEVSRSKDQFGGCSALVISRRKNGSMHSPVTNVFAGAGHGLGSGRTKWLGRWRRIHGDRSALISSTLEAGAATHWHWM